MRAGMNKFAARAARSGAVGRIIARFRVWIKEAMRIGLFATCLVDLMRPEIGFSVLKLLESAGYEVMVPEAQTCCGQPAYNSGASAPSRATWPKNSCVSSRCSTTW